MQERLLRAADKIQLNSFLNKGTSRAQITGSIFYPFWRAANNFEMNLKGALSLTKKTCKLPVYKIISHFPLAHDIYTLDWKGDVKFQDNILLNLILSLLNPVKMLESLLGFIQLSLCRLFEIGLEAPTTPIPQQILKGLVSLVVTVIKIPLTILRPFSDILPAIVNNLIIQPVKYIHGRLSTPARLDPYSDSSFEGWEETKGPDSPKLRVTDSSKQQHRARVRAQDLPGEQRDLKNDNKFYPIGGADQGKSPAEEEKKEENDDNLFNHK